MQDSVRVADRQCMIHGATVHAAVVELAGALDCLATVGPADQGQLTVVALVQEY